MKEAQQVVAEKTSALEAEAYKTKRLQVSFNSWKTEQALLSWSNGVIVDNLAKFGASTL